MEYIHLLSAFSPKTEECKKIAKNYVSINILQQKH